VTLGTTTYYKSIYFPPAATYDNGTLWLAFATGERTQLKRMGDASTTAENNRFYSLMEPDPWARDNAPTTVAEDTLFDATSVGNSCPSMNGFDGYYVLARDSEKFITNVDIFAYQVIAASYTPTNTTNPCSTSGEGSLYVFRVSCGQGYFAGTGPEARRFEMGAGMPTDPRVTVSPTGTRVIITQQDGEIENGEGPPLDPEAIRQLYWRELFE
jgi:hypothetical protein